MKEIPKGAVVAAVVFLCLVVAIVLGAQCVGNKGTDGRPNKGMGEVTRLIPEAH